MYMKKTHIYVFSLFLIVAGFSTARAAFPQGMEHRKDARENLRQELRKEHGTLHQGIMDKRRELRMEASTTDEMAQQKRQMLHDEIKKEREDFKKMVSERRDALKKSFGIEKAQNIERLFAHMIERFEAVADRLNTLSDRISAMLDKASARGKDVSLPAAKLIEARAKIDAFQKTNEDVKTKYTEAVKSSDVRTSFGKVKNIVRDLKEKAKDAHHALVETITTIKGLGWAGDKATSTIPSASSTAPTTTP